MDNQSGRNELDRFGDPSNEGKSLLGKGCLKQIIHLLKKKKTLFLNEYLLLCQALCVLGIVGIGHTEVDRLDVVPVFMELT